MYDAIPKALRAALHLQAARSLADADAGPGKVAAHLVAAPGTVEGWVRDWLVRAAPALIYQAPQVAAELLRAVLADLADDAPEREPLEADLIRVAFMQWQHKEVERTGTKLLSGHLDANRRAEIAWFVAYAQLRQGKRDRGSRPDRAGADPVRPGGRPLGAATRAPGDDADAAPAPG